MSVSVRITAVIVQYHEASQARDFGSSQISQFESCLFPRLEICYPRPDLVVISLAANASTEQAHKLLRILRYSYRSVLSAEASDKVIPSCVCIRTDVVSGEIFHGIALSSCPWVRPADARTYSLYCPTTRSPLSLEDCLHQLHGHVFFTTCRNLPYSAGPSGLLLFRFSCLHFFWFGALFHVSRGDGPLQLPIGLDAGFFLQEPPGASRPLMSRAWLPPLPAPAPTQQYRWAGTLEWFQSNGIFA